MSRFWRLLLLSTVAIIPGAAHVEEPYLYSPLQFNKGMRPAAGLFAGESPIDVQNGLWDNTGFLYPRSGFKLFNGRTRILGNREIGGVFRYVRRTEPPFYSAQASFLAADSQWVYQDASVTDTLLGFKEEPLSVVRGQLNTVNTQVFVYANTSAPTRFIEEAVSFDSLFNMIDSASYIRIAGNNSNNRILVNSVISNETLYVRTANSSTLTGVTDWRLFPALDIGSQKFFAQMGNLLIFGDSTKPTWQWDGSKTKVNYIADSGHTYAATTTLLRDGSKGWFPNEWAGFWLRSAEHFYHGNTPALSQGAHNPYFPILGNDDTSLTLKYAPDKHLTAGKDWYIVSFPVERRSSEKTISTVRGDSILKSTDISVGTQNYFLSAYPIQILITSGPGAGELRVPSGIVGDSIMFYEDKFVHAPTTASKFVFIINYPIVTQNVVVHQDRLWYVGDGINKNRLWYSEPLEPSNVGPFNYVDVFPRGGDVLTNFSSYQGQGLAYLNNSIARVVGDNPSNFVVLPFLENLGTPGINTRTSHGDEEYFYDYRTGLYALRSFNPVRLSDPVKPLLDSVSSAGAKNAALTYFKDHLWFAYPAGANQTKNNRLLTYNVKVPDSWARHTFTRCANFSTWPLTGDSTRLTCGDPDSGLVYVYTDTAHADAYTSGRITLVYKTGWMDFASPQQRKRWRGFQLAFDMNSASDGNNVYLYKDFSATEFDTLVFQRDGQLNNYLAKDINGLGYGRFFQLKLETAPRDIVRIYEGRMKYTAIGF